MFPGSWGLGVGFWGLAHLSGQGRASVMVAKIGNQIKQTSEWMAQAGPVSPVYTRLSDHRDLPWESDVQAASKGCQTQLQTVPGDD